MSSTLFIGFVALSDGRKVTTENPVSHRSTTHSHYSTVIQTPSAFIPAEVRTWSAAADPILPNDTVAFLIGKLHAPASQPAFLDAITLAPFGGDPSQPEYEDSIPDVPYPFIISTGSVVTAPEKLVDNNSLAYTVSSSEYVKDQTRTSRIFTRFDASRPRWRNTPAPKIGTALQVIGTAFGRHATGVLEINAEHLTLNIGGSVVSGAADSGSPPAKRKRFATAASATAPASAATAAVSATNQPVAGPSSSAHTATPIPADVAADAAAAAPLEASAADAKPKKTVGLRKAGGKQQADADV